MRTLDLMVDALAQQRYSVVAEISRSERARVWRVDDLEAGREVALKTIQLPDDRRTERIEWFELRLDQLRATREIGLPEILDFGVWTTDELFVACEWVDGTQLEELGQQSEAIGLFYATQVADCLARLAQKQQALLTVSPANVLVRDDGQVRLLGLGTGYCIPEATRRRRAQVVNPYRAPEAGNLAALKHQELWRADLFSIAALICDQLGATVQGAAGPVPQVELPMTISALPTGRELELILRDALRLDPLRRPNNYDEFIQILERCLGELSAASKSASSGAHITRRELSRAIALDHDDPAGGDADALASLREMWTDGLSDVDLRTGGGNIKAPAALHRTRPLMAGLRDTQTTPRLDRPRTILERLRTSSVSGIDTLETRGDSPRRRLSRLLFDPVFRGAMHPRPAQVDFDLEPPPLLPDLEDTVVPATLDVLSGEEPASAVEVSREQTDSAKWPEALEEQATQSETDSAEVAAGAHAVDRPTVDGAILEAEEAAEAEPNLAVSGAASEAESSLEELPETVLEEVEISEAVAEPALRAPRQRVHDPADDAPHEEFDFEQQAEQQFESDQLVEPEIPAESEPDPFDPHYDGAAETFPETSFEATTEGQELVSPEGAPAEDYTTGPLQPEGERRRRPYGWWAGAALVLLLLSFLLWRQRSSEERPDELGEVVEVNAGANETAALETGKGDEPPLIAELPASVARDLGVDTLDTSSKPAESPTGSASARVTAPDTPPQASTQRSAESRPGDEGGPATERPSAAPATERPQAAVAPPRSGADPAGQSREPAASPAAKPAAASPGRPSAPSESTNATAGSGSTRELELATPSEIRSSTRRTGPAATRSRAASPGDSPAPPTRARSARAVAEPIQQAFERGDLGAALSARTALPEAEIARVASDPETRALLSFVDLAAEEARLFEEALAADRPIEALERANRLHASFPAISSGLTARERATAAARRHIEQHLNQRDGTQALVDLDRIGVDSPNPEEMADLRQQAVLLQQQSAAAQAREEIALHLRQAQPHLGLSLLPRLADDAARRSLEAELQESLADLDRGAPTIELDPFRELDYSPGQPVEIRLRAEDDYEVTSISFRLRLAGEDETDFRELPVQHLGGRVYRVTVDPRIHQNRRILFWAEAYDRSGHIGKLGSIDKPLRLRS